MRRRDFIAYVVGGIAASPPFSARAEQRIRRVAALIGFAEDDPATRRRVAVFLKALAELGWIPNRNIALEFRYGAGDAARNAMLAKEVVGLNPEVIFVNSTSATAAVHFWASVLSSNSMIGTRRSSRCTPLSRRAGGASRS